jgi:hypothetical protein
VYSGTRTPIAVNYSCKWWQLRSIGASFQFSNVREFEFDQRTADYLVIKINYKIATN